MADVSKYSVVDPRIVQQKPKYAVEKGALSITNQTFSAIANSASQQTFQVQVPSENIFVDRAVDWQNDASVVVTLTYGSTGDVPSGGTGGNALLTPGLNFSLAPFPITQSVSTLQSTINDQSLSINMADVLPQVLRLADLSKTRMQRTTPTMLDRYYEVKSAATYPNSPVGSWEKAYASDEVPNGGWGQLSFYVPTVAGSAGAVVRGSNGLLYPPVTPTAGGLSLRVGVRFQSTEKLVLPPFIFADEHELSTGLFGVQNMQFTMNFNQPGRSLRIVPDATVTPTVEWDSAAPGVVSGSPFSTAKVQVQFLTPSLDVPLPAKSIVPWMEFPRYISPVASADQSGGNYTLQSQTITLPLIPDLLIIYVKPQSYKYPPRSPFAGQLDPTQSDWSMPISKISLSFDNFSGLLSNHTQAELYKMSVNNGLVMDWDEWTGSAWAAGEHTALVGGPLVLRPGRDFALSTGQACGLVGNFTLQYNLTCSPEVGAADSMFAGGVSIYTVTANSGFFETIKGSSRILRGVVTEQDILAAPIAEPAQSMERMVGEGKHKAAMGHKKSGMHEYSR
jgi:hypothetical protein